MKSLLLGILCVFFIFTVASVSALDFEITSGSELSLGGRNSHKQDIFTRTVTIRNNHNLGADIYLENIRFVFTPQNNFRSSGVEINDTPNVLNFSEQRPVSVNVRLEDFDAVDEDLEPRGPVEIGTLKFTADAYINGTTNVGSVETGTIMLKLEIKNDLEIVSVEIKSGDGSFSGIDADETVTITVDEDYDLRFKIKNNFESNSNVELEDISIQILSDDLDIDKSTSISEILPAQQGEKTTSISVDSTDTGEVKVLVEGNDRYGGRHGEVFIFNFRVEEAAEEDEPVDEHDEDGDGVPDGEDACLGTVSVCDVDANGCPIDSDEDGTCDSLDTTPRPTSQSTDDEIDTSSGNDEELQEENTKSKQTPTDEDSTSGFIPFLIGFAVGIMVTAGFSVLIKS